VVCLKALYHFFSIDLLNEVDNSMVILIGY